jgi:hypothetical protein
MCAPMPPTTTIIRIGEKTMRLPRNDGKRPRREPSRRPARQPRPISLDSRRSTSFHFAISYEIAVPRSGVNGPQHQLLKVSFGKSQSGTTVLLPGGVLASRPESVSRTQSRRNLRLEPHSDRWLLFYFSRSRNLFEAVGFHPITTRRFTRKWQDETPGVTQLLSEAWRRVPQR